MPTPETTFESSTDQLADPDLAQHPTGMLWGTRRHDGDANSFRINEQGILVNGCTGENLTVREWISTYLPKMID